MTDVTSHINKVKSCLEEKQIDITNDENKVDSIKCCVQAFPETPKDCGDSNPSEECEEINQTNGQIYTDEWFVKNCVPILQ